MTTPVKMADHAVATGVLTLAGAAVGGVSGYVVAWLNGNTAKKVADRAQVERVGDVRRAAYTAMLTQFDLLHDKLREVVSYERPPSWEDPLAKSYVDIWNQALQAKAAVEVIGPADVSTTANGFYAILKDNCNLIDAWIDGNKVWTDEDMALFESNRTLRNQHREAFVTVASSGAQPS